MKTILITGASSGIGKDVALAYANLGYTVYAGGRDATRLENIAKSHANIHPFIADLTSKSDINQVTKQFPPLDILFLNAGNCEYIDDVIHFDGDLFERVMTTNVISVGYCLAAWMPLVKKGGQLAFTSSSASFLPLPRAQAYGASKAALSYLANTMRIELAQHKISVSVIHPGFVKTALTDKNTFAMPNMISSEKAAETIVKGLARKQREINFPLFFTLMLRCFSWLPSRIWQKISQRLIVSPSR